MGLAWLGTLKTRQLRHPVEDGSMGFCVTGSLKTRQLRHPVGIRFCRCDECENLTSLFQRGFALLAGLFGVAALAGCIARLPAAKTSEVPAIRFRDVTQTAGLSWTRINGAFGKKWMPET